MDPNSAKDTKPALEPTIIVIFGITGDLSKRYLMPALYRLFKGGLLHEKTIILGVTRRDVTTDQLLGDVELCVNEVDGICDPEALKVMRERLMMFKMDLTEANEFTSLKEFLDKIEDTHGVCMNRLYYLSIPPQVYGPIVNFMGEKGLNGSCQHGNAKTRLLVEKPFGFDSASAKELIENTNRQFTEEQIFRIDHYLAKETVQNILAFRFNNPIFESLWHAGHISSIQITASEQLDIEGRQAFYEQTGALRDLIQSHLLQLLAVVAMDRPAELNSDLIHANRLQLLQAVEPIPADKVSSLAVRGQYEGYRADVGNPESRIETFAAICLAIGTERWQGVPVLIRTGKALNEKRTEVQVVFKEDPDAGQQNVLIFRISPDEGIELNLMVKKPGFDAELQPVPMDFSYQRSFVDSNGHPDAYERVLVDAVRGDHTLFATGEEVIASWDIIEPVLEVWRSTDAGLEAYPKGSTGPASAGKLAENAGTKWL